VLGAIASASARCTGHQGIDLFASEIRGLLASGLVQARPDLRGINHLFSFFSLPGPVTCFQGVQLLPPGHFLTIRNGTVTERAFWKMDFPDAGHEDSTNNEKRLVDEFERVLVGAVERRLRADVPVVSYLSGGVDSTTVVSLASRVRGEPIPTFTIRITDPALDETSDAKRQPSASVRFPSSWTAGPRTCCAYPG
jgi:asparagine synthase (glutamine-hydrolysing)